MQAFGSTNSLYFSPSFGEDSVFYSDQVLAGLPPCAEAEAPIHDTVTDAAVATFAESLWKGGEAIAKNISSGFTTLFKRFGTRTAELQPTEPQPTAIAVPREPASSALSYTEGTPALSFTLSNLTLMRRIVGLKVSGTLRGAAVASEAMSNGLLTAGYTDCGSDGVPHNPFEGFVWDAPDGKIPWYCDEDGVRFDDKVPVNGRDNIPAGYLCDPVMPWEELSEKAELPEPSTSASASLATTPTQGSLVSSAGPKNGMPEELVDVPSALSSVDSFPRYIPVAYRDARHSTCDLDLGKERAFYQRYEDRMKSAVKPYMRGRRSFQRY
ncbi:uncharacterized protein DFL_000298 [Arthrobotrys flagrans]|uniref:Uncharacterized protein n=1 Tax=Arthrobotrys flagrans TaxID=97331 RepID=A0A437ADH1_ARTFL|nr:hypothetical protein DFL_000298 [Arthrobotrys flagrans]